ncbi:RdgB/HAM1 family non-canonical purine NTP pyrophosphatase [Tissierella creatinini]|nr:RdgB/HAM1 family non-canonical purine NTP pyrophosphatase [Tissierella creatinini]TJX62924.1 RdgB/HAM1 family non-canonical purine NTP pyrophosphatase [Soehngenia saccharolytica]
MNKRKLVLSTENKHKVDEIKAILRDIDIEVVSRGELDIEDFHVVEDGETLEENSIKKARELAERCDYMVIADDTGLFVNALNGQPGIYSSRYAGEDGNDYNNCTKLLKNLEDQKDRSAYFKTVIALITENKKIYTLEGICKGSIETERKGSGGFGYDPVFKPEGYDHTFAELGESVKNKISHRAKALIELKESLKSILED